MAPHTSSSTPEQIDTLLNFLDEHKDLARGRLRSIEGKVAAKRLWEELCNTLNSMGGCIKTMQQWQKVWFDRKHLAKKAAADARRSASATGGGPSTAPQLSQWELKVLSIMGDGFGGRQTGARVPAFGEPFPEEACISSEPSQNNQQVDESPPSQHTEPVTVSQTKRPQIENQPQRVLESLTSRYYSQNARRLRRQIAGSDVRSRLFHLEEERAVRETIRNTEVSHIRDALLQLNLLLSEYLNRH